MTPKKQTLIKVSFVIVSLFYYLSLILLPIGVLITIIPAAAPELQIVDGHTPTTHAHVAWIHSFDYMNGDVERTGEGLVTNGDLALHIDNPLFNVASDFSMYILIAIAAYGLKQLMELLRDAQKDTHFTHKNAKRLKRLGAVVIVYAIVEWLSQFLIGLYTDSVVTLPDSIELYTGTPEYSWLLGGLLVIILGHIFDNGAELKEDQELTV